MQSLPQCDHDGFLAYWNRLKNDAGGVPTRKSVDPRAISKALPYYYLLQRTNHDLVPVRILGTALDAFLPTLSTGMNFLEIYPEEIRSFYAEMLRDICEHPCGARVKRFITMTSGSQVAMQSLALPLADGDGRISYIAGIADAPSAAQLLGLAEKKQRMASTVEELEYLDVGYGVPESAPTLPALHDMPVIIPEPEISG